MVISVVRYAGLISAIAPIRLILYSARVAALGFIFVFIFVGVYGAVARPVRSYAITRAFSSFSLNL